MIINISRVKTRSLCRRKAFNVYHRHLTSPSRSMNLVDGGAFHKGVAAGLATKDWNHALVEAGKQFDEDRKSVVVLPELEFQMNDHKEMIEVMIGCYRDAFKDQGIQVIQPECEFDVELPDSHHNCINLHWLDSKDGVEYWGPPPAEAIREKRVSSPHGVRHQAELERAELECPCYQPHRFVGKTDAVVVWNGMIWLLEHKTTAIMGEQFWAQWRLDIQPTGYIYGIQKSLNIKVGGFILNALYKPSEAQVSGWNKKRKYGPPQGEKDYIRYEREAFLRSPEDLQRFETELINTCNEWERDIINGSFPHDGFAATGACQQYNRTCDFHSACCNHDSQDELEALGRREKDYVDIKLSNLLPASPTSTNPIL